MLQAQSNKGEFITLALHTKTEIENFKRNFQFYCPTCKELVMMKVGQLTIPHFAHYPNTTCPVSKGGEGPYHEKGKLLLYQWLQSQHLAVELEPYVKEINQQPDILLQVNGKKIAVEYQCARISIAHIQSRNRGYKKVGIIPVWILGAKQFKRHGKYHLKTDQFTRQFIHQFSTHSSQRLLYFCPETLQFTIFQDIHMTKMKQSIGRFYFNKLYQMTFTDLFMEQLFSQENLYDIWKREKRSFRLSNAKQFYGKDLAWRQWLYLQHIHLEHLPSLIHLPVSAQHLMKTPPWDWQSRLYMGIINPLPVGHQFTLTECYHLLCNHFYRLTHYPLIHSTENPIQQYIHLLIQLRVIKKQSTGHYIKIKETPFHNHIETALIGDELIMDELIAKSRGKV